MDRGAIPRAKCPLNRESKCGAIGAARLLAEQECVYRSEFPRPRGSGTHENSDTEVAQINEVAGEGRRKMF